MFFTMTVIVLSISVRTRSSTHDRSVLTFDIIGFKMIEMKLLQLEKIHTDQNKVLPIVKFVFCREKTRMVEPPHELVGDFCWAIQAHVDV